MPLRGKKPSHITKRLKVFFYGPAKVGKTTCAIQFPHPYLIDTERGAENDKYVELLEKNNGVVFQATEFDEVLTEVKSLMTEKHEYKTLIIDPLTIIYNDLLDESAKAVGTDFGRHYMAANQKMKQLINLLLRLDMNVIITAHSKNEYGDKMQVLGQTYDCYKKLDYIFDLIIEVQKRAKSRVGVVKGTRLKEFEEDSSFPFSYESFKDKYDPEALERVAKPEQWASPDQVKTLTHLIELMKIDDKSVKKWLTKANSNSLEEMKSEDIEKCIKFLDDKIHKEK